MPLRTLVYRDHHSDRSHRRFHLGIAHLFSPFLWYISLCTFLVSTATGFGVCIQLLTLVSADHAFAKSPLEHLHSSALKLTNYKHVFLNNLIHIALKNGI